MSRWLLALGLIVCLSSSVMAQSPATIDGPRALKPATPLAKTIEGIRAEARAQVADLQVRLRTAKGQEQLDLMRQVQQIKTNAQIQVLETILVDARAKHDDRRIKDAELALDNLRHPEKYRTAAPARVTADR